MFRSGYRSVMKAAFFAENGMPRIEMIDLSNKEIFGFLIDFGNRILDSFLSDLVCFTKSINGDHSGLFGKCAKVFDFGNHVFRSLSAYY